MPVLVAKSAEETKRVAREFARFLMRELELGKHATVIALSGALGGGKTTFAQGFAAGLGVKGRVRSPTFILMQRFPIRVQSAKFKVQSFNHFYHLDCYRLKKPQEVRAIGLPEVLENPRNLVLIEWAEKIKSALPKRKIVVKFFHVGENTRKINFD